MNTVWKYIDFDKEIASNLADELEIPLPVANIMASRNIHTPEDAHEYFDVNIKKMHNPFLLPDIRTAIDRLNRAIDDNEKIFVWGDYDVDGVTATAVVVTSLNLLGANIEYKVPHRMEDGYDIKMHSVDEAIKRNATLMLSVDCGIVAFETAEYAKQKGLDLIITDHHHPSEDGSLPCSLAVINPNRDDPYYPGHLFSDEYNKDFKRYPFDALAGVGIAFKVMLALAHSRKFSIKTMVEENIEYVALGTVADVAPMIDENRILVHLGCDKLSNSNKPGVKALLKVAGAKEVNTTTIGFQIGPRINAIGRLADSGTALDLLLEKNEVRANFLATQLDHANKKRQTDQEKATEDAINFVMNNYDLDNTNILVVWSESWHAGLIGLIAGKIAEKFNKPTLCCTIKNDGYAKGSCRSVRDFNILDALKSEKAWALFKKRADGSTVCGGHAFAAGFELHKDNLKPLQKALDEYAKNQPGVSFEDKIVLIDSKMSFSDVSSFTYEELTKLSPFGSMNLNPVFSISNLKLVKKSTMSNDKHLKLKFSSKSSTNTIDANGWRKGYLFDTFTEGNFYDVAFTLSEDSFYGRKNISLIIEDIKPSKTA